jgi:hypothetical protein
MRWRAGCLPGLSAAWQGFDLYPAIHPQDCADLLLAAGAVIALHKADLASLLCNTVEAKDLALLRRLLHAKVRRHVQCVFCFCACPQGEAPTHRGHEGTWWWWWGGVPVQVCLPCQMPAARQREVPKT